MQHLLGVDLDDWFLGYRHWDTLLEFLGEMDNDGRYKTAIRDDDEMTATSIRLHGKPKPAYRPRIDQWTKLDDYLTDVKDMLNVLITVCAHSNERVQPHPRPQGALERWEKKERRENTDFLESQLFPDQ